VVGVAEGLEVGPVEGGTAFVEVEAVVNVGCYLVAALVLAEWDGE
jgi:hypothetical protein